LGAGKTTLARAWLAELGHRGAVRSPSYTLLEPYEGEGWRAWHLDLYRLGGPEELELLGVRDLLAGPGLLLVEWPERGGPAVPPADLEVALSHDGPPGRRRVRLLARSPRGAEALGRLAWAEGEAGG
ncbi:MAG: tRNA (adenosine(37)-N6)-threonylcarbamoyltransferase complex ATPase subunit type 1 TsaE, partial [Gammaproteobacteria bacterium]